MGTISGTSRTVWLRSYGDRRPWSIIHHLLGAIRALSAKHWGAKTRGWLNFLGCKLLDKSSILGRRCWSWAFKSRRVFCKKRRARLIWMLPVGCGIKLDLWQCKRAETSVFVPGDQLVAHIESMVRTGQPREGNLEAWQLMTSLHAHIHTHIGTCAHMHTQRHTHTWVHVCVYLRIHNPMVLTYKMMVLEMGP